jgi:hypothetical protein
MVDVAGGVVVCGRVRRREPFSNVLLDLVPYGQVSVFTMQAMEVADHQQVISSILFVIATLAFLASGRTKVQRKVDEAGGSRTIFVLNSGLHSQSYGHPDHLLDQAI